MRQWEYEVDECNPAKVKFLRKKEEIEHLSFPVIQQVVEEMMALGLKTVELTGAGDPSLYKCKLTGKTINDVIDYLFEKGLQIGMITNGVRLTSLVKQECLDKLSWLRISLSGLDRQNTCVAQPVYPDVPQIKGVLGFSFVWSPHHKLGMLKQIASFADKHGANFVRIVPDCLDIEKQKAFKKKVGKNIDYLNQLYERELLFYQTKDYSVYPRCRIGWLKPFLNADGYFYHCSAVPLYNQAFTPHWRMGHYTQIKNIWMEGKAFIGFNPDKCEKGKCFYCDQNEMIDDVVSPGVHKEFV
jgi:hypothetical protein